MNEEMEKKENDDQKNSTIDKVIGFITVVGAFLVGRFLGLLGVGAIAIGWFVYYRTKEKLGRFVAICAGSAVALATYGLAIITIFS